MSRDEDIEIMARAISLDLGEDPDARDVLIRGRPGERPHWEGFESAAEAALTALEASGRAVVPREPTEDMILAGTREIMSPSPQTDAREAWEAMLAASPSPPMKGQKG